MASLFKVLNIFVAMTLLCLQVLLFSCKKEDKSLPDAQFNFQISDGDNYPVQVTFENTSKKADTYLWTFGNGQTSTEKNPVESYTKAGTFKVTLIAENAYGRDSVTQDIAITTSAASAAFDFIIQNDGELPARVLFTNKSDQATSYTWLFGDGQSSNAEDAVNEFESNGVYNVQLVAHNPAGNDTAIQQIRIHPRFGAVGVYLITPRDESFNKLYYDSVTSCINQLQQWYKQQMGNNKTFETNPLVADTLTGLHDLTWYDSYNGEFSGNDPRFYAFQNTLQEMQQLLGDKFDMSKRTYMVYVAAPGGGAGYTGFTALGDQDLKGLLGINPENFNTDRWIGGAGHELGHAFGLPHPENELSDAIMWTGYLTYPNCILQDSDRDILNASSFFK